MVNLPGKNVLITPILLRSLKAGSARAHKTRNKPWGE